MRILTSLFIVAFALLAAGCGSSPGKDRTSAVRPDASAFGASASASRSSTAARARTLAVSSVGYDVTPTNAGFTRYPAAERFVQDMSSRHGFDAEYPAPGAGPRREARVDHRGHGPSRA